MKRNLRGVAIPLVFVFLVVSCKSEQQLPPVETVQPSSTPGALAASQPPGGVPQAPTAPPAVTQSSWSPDALEELLAPIALYPDQLLGQILAASVNSQEVMDGGNWLLQNQTLTGNDLDAAAQKVGFGPAMRALLQFPTVVDMMCQQIDWTRQVGSAFTSDQKSVLDAVQRLRSEAASVGNLKSTPQQTVTTKTEGSTTIVQVMPADPKVVYVPQYDPQVVYTTPPPAQPAAAATTTTTTETTEKKDDHTDALISGLVGFGVGMIVGNAIHDDDYYYPNWGSGGVYYGGRPFYPPAYAYRPAYGPAFRPAYGYAPPAGYRNNYANVRSNNNVVINNNNYYNRFDKNQNLRTGNSKSPIANSPRVEQQRVAQGQSRNTQNRNTQNRTAQNRASTSDFRGQSTYAGARNGNANVNTRNAQGNARAGNSAVAQPRGNANTARPQANNQQLAARTPDRTANTAQRADRGYGDSNRTANRAVNTPAQSRPSQPAATPRQTPQTAQRPAPQKESAFSGAQAKNSGSFERSASARGNASVGTRPASAPKASGGGARRR